jgi:hypothetical protein
VIQSIVFKDWLPDQPALGNPGLTDATGVLPVDGTYKSFLSLTAGANSTAAAVTSPVTAFHAEHAGSSALYIGSNRLYVSNNSGVSFTDRSAATYNTATHWEYEQFDDLAIAANLGDRLQAQTIGSTSAFTALSASAPYAQVVGKVGRFLVAGQLASTAGSSTADRPNVIQWSAIDDPTNWPTPGSSTAVAFQAGEQILNSKFGKVQFIAGGDQFGVVVQETGVTRMTYVGGDVVFQFDEVDSSPGIGAFFPNATIQVGGLVYFISPSGFFVTDGTQVVPIGNGVVDRFFWGNVSSSTGLYRVTVGHDPQKKLIYWGYALSNSLDGVPQRVLIYNYVEKRWSVATQSLNALVSPPPFRIQTGLSAFNTSGKYSTFSGAPPGAVMTSGEIEGNPGGYTYVSGIKPLVDVTVNAVTAALGTRSDQSSSVTYTSEVTANSRSGFCDFRSEARYHRARLTIAGTFNAAQGFEYDAEQAGGL